MVGWRARVRVWLRVVEEERWVHGDWLSSARQNAGAFPKNWLLWLVREVLKSAATWIVKSALRQAASDLGFALDDATLNVLADLVVTFL